MRSLLITGAAGGVGTMLRQGLRGLADEIRLFGRTAIEGGGGERALSGDVVELATVRSVYGVSANHRRWWDLEAGRRLGQEPLDDAEVYASEVAPNPVGRFQGGPKFTDPGTTP